MYKPADNSVYENIRRPLQARLVQYLFVDEKILAKLSIIELLSVLYSLWGQTNSLGAYGEVVNAFRIILGDDLLWSKPKLEVAVSEVIQ